MAKYIEVKKGGYVWIIDLEFVAKHRANHYKDDPDTTEAEEIAYVMDDDYEGIDWYQNNMNWSDIPDDKKRLIKSPEVPNGPDDVEAELDDDGHEITEL